MTANIILGKIERLSNGKKIGHVANKQDRRNTSRQLMKNKVSETSTNKRLYSGHHGVPKVVTLVPLTGNLDFSGAIRVLCESLGISGVSINSPGMTNVYCERFKQNISFLIPMPNFTSILDAAKVADFVVFGLSAVEEVGSFGDLCIRSIESQGVSTAFSIIPDLDKVEGAKVQADVKDSLFSYFSHFFPDSERIYSTASSSDVMNLSRSLCQKTPKGVSWRDERSYLMASSYHWNADSSSETGGYLVAEGIVRGQGMTPDRLVHITGFGDFQVEKIEVVSAHGAESTDQTITASEEKDDLEELAPFDEGMVADEEEMEEIQENDQGVRLDGHRYFRNEYKEELEQKFRSKKFPEGISAHQARWIVDDKFDISEDESESEMVEIDDEDGFGTSQAGGVEEYEPTEAGDLQSELFVELNEEDEEQQLKEFRQRARDNFDFPDEIELLPSVSAKDRMSRYRGLKNLQSCIWDTDEKDMRAPEEWTRLLRVQNYKGTRNRVLKEAVQNAKVEVGARVRVYVKANQTVFDSLQGNLLVLYGLLQYEHKLAVVNLNIQQNAEYEEAVPAKATLIAQCGPRRLVIRPIFSQAGRTDNNVYKYQRFMYPGDNVTATVIAPLMFGSVPVVLFKQEDQGLRLVGSGSVLNVDHSRILAKRSVLTGHPFKIHKKVVTIRYMFFNREDIMWFKAVPLFTRMGNSGYIREPLGTHGYFKATFDHKINPQDTVAMALYKRVWPKMSCVWTGL